FASDNSTLLLIRHILPGGGLHTRSIESIAAFDAQAQELSAIYFAGQGCRNSKLVFCYDNPNGLFLPRYVLRHYGDGSASIVEVANGRECFVLPADWTQPPYAIDSEGISLTPNQSLVTLAQSCFRTPNPFRGWIAKFMPGLATPTGSYDHWI